MDEVDPNVGPCYRLYNKSITLTDGKTNRWLDGTIGCICYYHHAAHKVLVLIAFFPHDAYENSENWYIA